ncbi:MULTISPECIES: hypothetical protein [unclassified Kitasatospora]|uniref:hypothetical protein n=1 Tax=unclassified Kitasatospora TaxID=2633591 RepID=UPI00070EBE00|nr:MULTISPECIES: hypothetical protein [unclassified Kitasatospora]KQV18626.1 hypothetical protein ASC99_05240 [Kitasatospora sp. Root107]KRB74608.1 hypothetical protein ASE03_19175 [Kitasatospora sp. Root187]
MKLSKRATGALLLAVGSGVLAGQSAAMAAPGSAPVTAGQVASIEDEWGTEEVPFTIPLETVSEHLPLLPKGGQVSGGVPTSLLMPPVPDSKPGAQLIPDRVVPGVEVGKVGPRLQAALPLPTADHSTELGDLALDAPAAPLNAQGPGLTLGQPFSWVEGNSGSAADDVLTAGELDPQLITAPVQAIPGAKASLGKGDEKIAVTDSLTDLTSTTTGTMREVLDQA